MTKKIGRVCVKQQQTRQLEQLYLEMYDWLLAYGKATLSDPSRGEEAVQETFRIACDKLPVLLASDNPKGWLVNTMKGVIRNFYRQDVRGSHVLVPVQESLYDAQLEGLPTELLYQDLAATKEYELMMKLTEAESIRELAKRLGISECCCKKRVQRARAYLKKRLTK